MIESYIKNQVLQPRLQDKGVLVVYDPDKRYRELCLELANAKVAVIDASVGSIEAREFALERLAELGTTKTKNEGMVIYTTQSKPQDEEQCQRDPFAIYIACGRVFPEGDGDRFDNICLKARSDHAAEVRKVFAADSSPSFAVINQIGGGPGWPQLQALLGADSPSGILFALLAPSQKQQESLKGVGDSWISEVKEFFLSSLGLKLMTKGKTWTSVGDELWRFLLFSEFVFDLPGQLPDVLTNVPRASNEIQHAVEDLCDRLRQDQRTSSEYVRRAEEVEMELNLPSVCKSIQDLGIRDTFPFEERTFLAQARNALIAGDRDLARRITDQHAGSIWRTKGENQAQWSLIIAAATLVARCEDLGRSFPSVTKDMASLIQYYSAHLRDADKLHREFEMAVEEYLDSDDGIEKVVTHARRAYRNLAENAHTIFLRYIEEEGWPPSGVPSNADTFDRYVAPLLQEKGNRVALILVDALRYELGLELKRQIADDGHVEMEAACASMPTVTPVGMASLLPEAGSKLRLVRVEDEVVPFLGETKLAGLQNRIKVMVERYGQRFHEMRLADFIKARRAVIPERTDLLVLRTTEMDTQLELSSQMSAPAASTLNKIRSALHRLREKGFHHVVIGTDHGFVLNATAEMGDVCAKPPGDWLFVHDRAVLGSGVSDGTTLVVPAARVGIQGDFESFGTPRSLSPYKSGLSYFHGGASIQEALVPIITIALSSEVKGPSRAVAVKLSYRNGLSKITTQRPVLEVSADVDDIFAIDQSIEVIVEARDSKGNVVGEAKPGGAVNPATGIIQLTPGQRVQVPLKMLPMNEFEGKFTIKAINPATLAEYGEGLRLETDYTG